MTGSSTVLKEESKVSPMVSMTGESTELIVAVAVEYRDKPVLAALAGSMTDSTGITREKPSGRVAFLCHVEAPTYLKFIAN